MVTALLVAGSTFWIPWQTPFASTSSYSSVVQSAKLLIYSQFPLRLNIACCMWWLCIAWLGSMAKNYQFSQLWNITGSKGRFDIPFPWQSMKLFTTNSCYETTTRNTQCSNAMEINCNCKRLAQQYCSTYL